MYPKVVKTTQMPFLKKRKALGFFKYFALTCPQPKNTVAFSFKKGLGVCRRKLGCQGFWVLRGVCDVKGEPSLLCLKNAVDRGGHNTYGVRLKDT
jgi:hypothetical protein